MADQATNNDEGRNFRAIDIAGVGVCDTTPENTYVTQVACSNCGFEGEGRFTKGVTVYSSTCPNCGVQHRLDERNPVKLAERAARREIEILQAQSGEALLRKILTDRTVKFDFDCDGMYIDSDGRPTAKRKLKNGISGIKAD